MKEAVLWVLWLGAFWVSVGIMLFVIVIWTALIRELRRELPGWWQRRRGTKGNAKRGDKSGVWGGPNARGPE